MTFTATNRDQPQTVTITGINDGIVNRGTPRMVNINHQIMSGEGDGVSYTAGNLNSVEVTLANTDTAGVTLSPTEVQVLEDSGTGRYTVVLDAGPLGNVTITATSDTTTAAQIGLPGQTAGNSQRLTFTPTNWRQPQTLIVTGVADSGAGERMATISHAIMSGDSDGVDYRPGNPAIDSVAVLVLDQVLLSITADADSVAEGTPAAFTIRAIPAPTMPSVT